MSGYVLFVQFYLKLYKCHTIFCSIAALLKKTAIIKLKGIIQHKTLDNNNKITEKI